MPIRLRLVRLTLLVALAGGVAWPLAGQTPPQTSASSSSMPPAAQKPPTGLILGQVLDATGGQPLAGAIVTMSGGSPTPATLNGAAVSPNDPAILGAAAAAPGGQRLITNASGQFVFHDLRPGSYRFTATAPGYVPGSYGQRVIGGPSRSVDLADDGRFGDATIKIWQYASLSGHVLDEAGEPVIGAPVRALRASTVSGRHVYSGGTQATTDDRGYYRLENLTPAAYIVAIPDTTATVPSANVDAYMTAVMSGGNASGDFIRELSASGGPFPSPGGIRIGDAQVQTSSMMQRALPLVPPADGGHLSVYPTVFYPSATAPAEASVITLTAGERRTGVDLQLRLVSTTAVYGTITGESGMAKFIGVRLVPASSEGAGLDIGFDTATTMTDANGAFSFFGVPAGQYSIKAQRVPRPQVNPSTMVTVMTSSNGAMSSAMGFSASTGPLDVTPSSEPSYFGELALSVSDRDMNGVSVALRRGVRVSGKVVFEGSATPPTANQLQSVTVALQALESRWSMVQAPPRVRADGQFTSLAYPPGRYLVSAAGALGPWRLRSVTLGGRSLDDAPIELQDEDITGVVVLFSDQSTEVRGSVHGGTTPIGEGDAMVIAFPLNYTAWIEQGMSPRRTQSGPTGKPGTYALTGLPPGEYYVVAVPSEGVTSSRDLAFYETLARSATRLTLADGEKKSFDLTMAPVR